ncbi:MAG: peptidylprolyl isomerase [bacterium]|jgi:peptidyl-prolyl cis-trans isomerase C
MLKNLMIVCVCGGVVTALSSGCNKSAEGDAKAPAPKVEKAVVELKNSGDKPTAPVLDPALVLVDVGGTKLTVAEADRQVMTMLGSKADQIPPAQMEALMGRFRQQAVQGFVVRTLLSQEADKRKFTVSDKDVDAELELIKTRLPEGKKLEEILKSENMTEKQLRADLTAKLRIDMLLKAEVPTNSVVTDEEIAKFYNEQKERFLQPETVQARHILIKLDATDDAKAKEAKKAKIEALRKQLVEGADFTKIALANSDCPSKERGGDLGSFPRGQMVKEFEEAAFNQATNAIGPVVETQFGYHIIQVMEHETAKTNSLEEVKPKLAEHLKQKQQMEIFEKLIEKLKKNTKIIQSDVLKQAPEMPMMDAQ